MARQRIAGSTFQHYEPYVGKTIPVRVAGMSYTQFAKYATHLASQPQATAKVPCGDCHACCYHERIEVYPARESAERLAHLDIVADPRGGLQLNKRPDGGCIHLTDQGKCGVYEYRPSACRVYDCRLFGFLGVALQHNDEHTEPVWQFDIRTTADKIMKAALIFLHDEYRKTHDGSVNPVDLIAYITTNLEPAKELMAEAWKFEDQMVQKMTRNERKNYHREMEAMANSQQ